jgi:hypothetical protein
VSISPHALAVLPPNKLWWEISRGDHFRFGSVFIKKSNQTEIFFFEKKTRNRVKPTGFGSVRFGFLRAKTGSNRFGSVFLVLARFSRFWLGFFGLARFFRFCSVFFPVFCRFRFGSVRFFWFFVYKTETEPAGFFKKLIGLIGFFFRFGFFGFFFWFSRFNRFSGFFAHP